MSPTTDCKTIGHAISLAASGDSLGVAAATYAENLTIGISLKVLGAGARTTIIDGGGVARVVTIPDTSTSVILSGMTIRNGHADTGGGVSNAGTLTITNTTISGNRASCTSGLAAYGGGISNRKTMRITSSTINGNWTAAGYYGCVRYCRPSEGGGFLNDGTLTITNSTLRSNSARRASIFSAVPLLGGGIANYAGSVALSSSTLSGNRADFGGGTYNNGSIAVQNTIVANNSGGNCAGVGPMVSNGYNLSSDDTCNFNKIGDLNNTNPLLGGLQYNGGPTQTQALQTGSPAIDAGNPNGCKDNRPTGTGLSPSRPGGQRRLRHGSV